MCVFLRFPFWLTGNVFCLVLQGPDYSKFVFERGVSGKHQCCTPQCILLNVHIEESFVSSQMNLIFPSTDLMWAVMVSTSWVLILTHMSSRLLCQLAVPFPRVLFNMFAVSRGVSSMEFGDLESLCKAVVKEKQPFERLEVSKETLLKMFKVSERGKTGVFCLDLYILLTPTVSIFQYNKFKCRILNEKVTTPTTTVYR